MTENQRKLAALQIEQSEVRQKLNDLLARMSARRRKPPNWKR